MALNNLVARLKDFLEKREIAMATFFDVEGTLNNAVKQCTKNVKLTT